MLRVLGNNQQLEDVYRTPVIKGNEPVEPDEPGISMRNIIAGSPGSSGSLKFLRIFKQGNEGYRCLGKSLVSTIFANPLQPLALEYASFAPTGT